NSALAAGPTLTATPASLTGTNALYYVEGNGPNSKTFSVSGNKLASAPGNVTVTSSNPAVFTVSPAQIPYNGTSLSATTVTVQLVAGLAVGPYSGTITLTGGDATLEVPVGGVVNSSNPITPISIARQVAGRTFTIQGRVTVTNQLGSRQIYIQDETGGIVVYSGPSGPDFSTQVQLGDLVEVRGPISVFNGFTEITGTDNFTVVEGIEKSIPEPKTITLNQLADYQGQLVEVVDATITPEAATFAGNSNYIIAASNQSGVLRINANSQLSGAGKPANPVAYVIGIADRFVSGATTPGTNGLQLQPRILEDIPGATAAQDQICTVPGPVSTLTLDKTLDIASWNMEFFGADAGTIVCPNGNLNYNDLGPTNEDLQQTNAITVLNKLNADIIAVQEMSDVNRLAATVAALPGSYSYICSDKFSYYFQDDCAQTPTGNPPVVFGPSSLSQKVCVIYNTATVTPLLSETQALFDGEFNYPNANNWSSGRLPFMFVADATIDGVTRRVHVVDIHAKSGSATADYNRRKQDIELLKARLDERYPDANLILLGDFNDKLNGSIATGQQSSYQSFVTDATQYAPITLPLENQGCSTFNSSASFIDHMIVSNELNAAYVSNSAYVIQPFSIPNYGNTTSDHNPIVARFDLTKLSTPITSLVATATPATICSNGISQLTATITGGGAPYTYTWTGPGTIATTGNATTDVSGLSAGPQIFTINVTDAYNQTASTTVTVQVNTQPNAPTLANASAVQGSAEVVLSAANCTGTLVWTGASSGSGSTLLVSTATPGTYDYTVSCQVGDCISEPTPVSVTIIPLLTATVSASPDAILTNQSTSLTATVEGGTAPYSYEWTGPGIVTNADQATATVSGLTPGEQVFTVKITDATTPTEQVVSKTVSVFVTQANREPIATTIPDQTATAGNSFSLDITTAFSDLDNDVLTYTATGLPAGLTLTNGVISGMPTTVEVKSVIVTATDPGTLSTTASFTFTVLQGALKMLTPTYNCEAGQLTANVIAGNGNPIEYQIPSVSKGWESKTTYPIEAKHIGKELKIRARQRASDGKGWDEVEVSFTPTACAANSRIGLPEAERVTELSLTVLGNPVADQVRFEIRGAEGQPVQLRLMDLQGRIIEARSINAAAEVEQHTFDVQRQASGILLLQATTPNQQKLVKVLKK
ncbi:MAG: endonuclease/exonuclease/phosphatase family protein, partial [Bacteroidetes bacterium]|nr:endonuclease/exonuclease/phosphatase family protein [Bacteroidota bacterium]